jgi:hypothetical protein
MACGKDKLTLQTDRNIPAGTHEEDPAWQFILEFLCVLEKQTIIRRLRLLQAGSKAGINCQESESELDMDNFLREFTVTETWAKLSNPSPEQ